jgi:hypothetical protein
VSGKDGADEGFSDFRDARGTWYLGFWVVGWNGRITYGSMEHHPGGRLSGKGESQDLRCLGQRGDSCRDGSSGGASHRLAHAQKRKKKKKEKKQE